MSALASWVLGLLSPFVGLLSAGCTPDDLAPSNDPLVGLPPPPPPSAAAGIGQPSAVVVPPLPPPSTGGTAGLVNGRSILDPTRPELRIGADSGSVSPPAPAWQPAVTPAAGVALQTPQPLNGAVPLQPKSTPTYEQLKAELKARGIATVSIKIDWTTGKTTVTCFGPETTGHKRYDVLNAADEVAALQAVLAQIDNPSSH
jgi:hypothetical protein